MATAKKQKASVPFGTGRAKSKKQKAEKENANRLSVPVYGVDGAKGGTIRLPGEVFGQKENPRLLSQAVRVFLANQRTAGPKTKGRGEIERSKAKWYRQKGTGRARHGSRSAPLFVGGGIAHGPRGFVPRLELPGRLRRLALAQALSGKLAGKLLMVAEIEDIEPRTKTLASLLQKLEAKKSLIVYSGKNNLFLAGRNIKHLDLVPAYQLNAYDVIANNSVILTPQAVAVITKRIEDHGKTKEGMRQAVAK